MNGMSVLMLAMLGLSIVEGKRGASGRVELGKFRLSRVQRDAIGKPLSGDQKVEERLEWIEEQKEMVKQQQENKKRKLAHQRARREEKRKDSMLHKEEVKEKQTKKDQLVEEIDFEEDEMEEDEDNDNSVREVFKVVERERAISQQQRVRTKTSLSRLLTARRVHRKSGSE